MSASTPSISAPTAPGSVTSSGALTPLISDATSSAPSAFRSATTTAPAPSLANRWAMARPMPLAAPVTTMVAFSICMAGS